MPVPVKVLEALEELRKKEKEQELICTCPNCGFKFKNKGKK